MSTTTHSKQLISTQLIEWLGTLNGIAGATLLAVKIDVSPYGWVLFAVSSLALTVFAYRIRAWGLLLLNTYFCCTNTIGMWRWLIEPALAAGGFPWAS